MLSQDFRSSLPQLVKSISVATKLISPAIGRHHDQAAYIAFRLAEHLGYSEDEIIKITLAAFLHDIGAVSLGENLDQLRFEKDYVHVHAELGAQFLGAFTPFRSLAPIIKHHHRRWNHGEGACIMDEPVPPESHLIHLADRAAVLINNQTNILIHKKNLRERISRQKGTLFRPEHVAAFMDISAKDYFWLDCASNGVDEVLQGLFKWETILVGAEALIDFSRFLSRLVDFRSPLNANHSSGVAASSAALARLAGFNPEECTMMLMGGYLHDIGKLVVPVGILEKDDVLDKNERSIIKAHAYYTHHILAVIPEFRQINQWASHHHERLDGKGYPFGLKEKEISPGAQLMAVADIYTALNEDRPYRKAMSRQQSTSVLNQMVKERALNREYVELLEQNFDEIDCFRCEAQRISNQEYHIINPLFAKKYQRGVKTPDLCSPDA
ncbi:HD-GYP domain-containing protein [Syntrophomonas palmitatica]|uniref:HD-GYP domain-containing protein n=1 Tax=Syntrophomonas palmitatica TaxID=402877 RepID=UPI0006D06AC3|nr:HD domain-containing phosphohydrolase [Syntrophomonas palmitatica]